MIRLIRDNKFKIVLLLISIVAWFLVLFPFGDLSDLLGGKVAEMTQNQLFVQFSRMQISWWPLGVQLGDTTVDTPYTGPLSISEVTISPSVTSLFSQIPSGTLVATEAYSGAMLKSASKSRWQV